MLLAILSLAARPAIAQTASATGEPPTAPATIRVVLPDSDNLQYLTFWVALGAGYFHDEGLAIETSVPSVPAIVDRHWKEQQAPAAVLPPPVYLALIAQGFPLKIVANLLANDGINLVVRRKVAEERGLSAAMPLAERLRRLRGLRVGVAPGPVRRLRALLSSEGLEDDAISRVIVAGQDQNEAFAQGKVDALFAHTPFLERALVEDDAVMLVNASAGEAPLLAGLQLHALAVTAEFAAEHPKEVLGLVRAIYRAERLVHTDQAAASAAVLRALPALKRELVDTIVAIYEPAVPAGPEVSAEALPRAIDLFPARGQLPPRDAAALSAYVEPRFAAEVVREAEAAAAAAQAKEQERARTTVILVVGAAALAAMAAATAWRARARSRARHAGEATRG